MNKIEKKMRSLPIILVLLYVGLTFSLSIIGPMKYIGYEYWRVTIFMILIILALGSGYILAHRRIIVIRHRPSYVYVTKKLEEKRNRRMIRFVKASILIALFACLVEFWDLYRMNPNLLNVTSIGANYAASRENFNGNSYSFAILLRFVTSFFRNVSFILGLYYLPKLSYWFKGLWGLFLGTYVWIYVVGYGTQKALADILVYFILIAGIKMIDMSAKYRRVIIGSCVVCVIIALVVFTIMQSSRAASIGLTAENYVNRSDGLAYFDTEHIIFKIFGAEIGFGLALILTSYLSSGYYGLSLCLQLPFVWCYGVGNSYALSVFASRFLGCDNMYYQSYLYRMEEAFGRNGLRSWNTIFPWLASDLSFMGVVLLFFVLGYLYAYMWDEILKYRNPVSILLFANLCLAFVFLPANNQLFSGIDACMSTPFVILLWILAHRKFNLQGEKDANIT